MPKLKNFIKEHITDSIALCTIANPYFSFVEPFIYGMTDETSINARLLGSTLPFLGIGYAVAKFRDVSRKAFNLTEKSKEKIIYFHDTLNLMAFNAGISPIFYYAAGSRGANEILIGTLGGIVFGLVGGGALGYATDSFKDLTGINECKRPSYPNYLKNKSSTVKKGIAAGLFSASVVTMAGIYYLTPDKINWDEIGFFKNNQTLEQVVNEENDRELQIK